MQTYFSPLSPTTVAEKNQPTLLLLFILKELLKNPQGLIEHPVTELTPFEWISKRSSIQKLREYFSLLPYAFPELASQVPTLALDRPIQELFIHLEPFILTCISNENLLLFLIRYQKELAVKPLLDRICPEGINVIREKITENFRKRGYYFTKWTHLSQKSSKTP
ncbi:MAG: hypothetical protein ACRDFB_09650 [Rhabdochlamydiaceae bacterium]